MSSEEKKNMNLTHSFEWVKFIFFWEIAISHDIRTQASEKLQFLMTFAHKQITQDSHDIRTQAEFLMTFAHKQMSFHDIRTQADLKHVKELKHAIALRKAH